MSRTINIEDIHDYMLIDRAHLAELYRAHRHLRWVIGQMSNQLDGTEIDPDSKIEMDFFDLEDIQMRMKHQLDRAVPLPELRVACFIQPKPRVRAVS
jgi:hypothetical protein